MTHPAARTIVRLRRGGNSPRRIAKLTGLSLAVVKAELAKAGLK